MRPEDILPFNVKCRILCNEEQRFNIWRHLMTDGCTTSCKRMLCYKTSVYSALTKNSDISKKVCNKYKLTNINEITYGLNIF